MQLRRRTKLTVKWTVALIAAGLYFLRDVSDVFLTLFWVALGAFLIVVAAIDLIFRDADPDT